MGCTGHSHYSVNNEIFNLKENYMAATPKAVRARHKSKELEIKHKLKKHVPETARMIMKGHKSTVKKAKSKFKEMGGKY